MSRQRQKLLMTSAEQTSLETENSALKHRNCVLEQERDAMQKQLEALRHKENAALERQRDHKAAVSHSQQPCCSASARHRDDVKPKSNSKAIEQLHPERYELHTQTRSLENKIIQVGDTGLSEWSAEIHRNNELEEIEQDRRRFDAEKQRLESQIKGVIRNIVDEDATQKGMHQKYKALERKYVDALYYLTQVDLH